MATDHTQAQIIEFTARVAAIPSTWDGVTFDLWSRYQAIKEATAEGFTPLERAMLIVAEFASLRLGEIEAVPADVVADAISKLAFLATPIPEKPLREFWFDGKRYSATPPEAVQSYFRMRERLIQEPFGKYQYVQTLGILTEQAVKEIEAGDYEGLTMLAAILTHDSEAEVLEWAHERTVQAMQQRAQQFRHLPLPILMGAAAFFLQSLQLSPKPIWLFSRLMIWARASLNGKGFTSGLASGT